MDRPRPEMSQQSGKAGKLYWRLPESGGVVMPSTHHRPVEVVEPLGGGDVVPVKFTGAGDAPPTTTSAGLGGPKLGRATRVNLIFWGGSWNSNPQPNPSAQTIVNDAASILSGPYLS